MQRSINPTVRRNKKSPKERIPKDLLNEAIKLGKKYGYSKTAKELGLNSTILLKRSPKRNTSSDQDVKVVKLAPLRLSDQKTSVNTASSRQNTLIAEVVSPSGVALRLFSGIDENCTKVLAQFVKEL